MKKLFALLLLLSLTLTSCSKDICAYEMLRELCLSYPINAEIYHSGALPYEDGYIDAEMLTALYGTAEPPCEDFAIVMYGEVGRAREIAVFTAETSDERMYLFELMTDRISFLSSFLDGEGFVKKYHGVIVYGFVDDAVGVQRAFDSLL